MSIKRWCVSQYNKELAKELSAECEADPIVALIATARGYTDPYDLEQFLSDEPYFCDPYEMADINEAAYVINKAIADNKKIAVYGDFDCDGVTATALMYTYLSSRGADCVYYIPDRFSEGYGMNITAVDKLHSQNVELIITVDNGIASVNEIKYAKSLGVDVVVTDHHLPHEVLPEASAVVNPHRKDCMCEFKEICGAEVAFRLICVLENKEPEELIYSYADLLTVAVIADIMPLTLENRSIVKIGVEKMKTETSPGLKALLNIAGIDAQSLDSGKIAFGICPRINAAGRMGSAAKALELLICDDILKALSLADEIDKLNALRQKTEKEIFAQAVDIIEKNGFCYDRVIVASGEGWHQGVVGIVASRICEKYGCPAILLSVEGDTASGSGRSIEGFSLYGAIDYCSDLTVKFGGHETAAGLTVKTENIDAFREKINEFAYSTDYAQPQITLDCKLNPSALTLDLAYSLKQLEPFGNGNRVPVFGLFSVTLTRITPIGNNKHLRLLFSKGENLFSALIFGVGTDGFCFDVGDLLDLAVTVDINSFKGEENVSVIIKAIRPSGVDDDRLFGDISALYDFYSGRGCNTQLLLPKREDIGSVYKMLCEASASEEKLKYKFINSLGVAKTAVALTVLKELCLIETVKNGKLASVNNSEKRNLSDSKTYKLLLDGGDNI